MTTATRTISITDVSRPDTIIRMIEAIQQHGASLVITVSGEVSLVFKDGSGATIVDPIFNEWVRSSSNNNLIDTINSEPAILNEFRAYSVEELGTGDDEQVSAFYSRLQDPFQSVEIDGSSVRSPLGEDRFKDLNFGLNLQETHAARLFSRISAGVGNDIPHLPGLPDEDYPRDLDPKGLYLGAKDEFVGAEPPRLQDDIYVLDEDNPISGNLFDNDYLPNAIGLVSIGQQPSQGTVVLNPDGTFTYTPDPNNSGDDTFTYIFIDPILGTPQEATVTIQATPVADAPTVSVGAGIFPTEEDTPVSLTGLGGALTDTDGSETLGFEISGVPAGAVFNGGTDLGGGVWSFTPAELAALTFTPPADEHGTFDLTLTAISTEGSNGDQATTALPFSIVVDAQADTPSLTSGSSAINEDGTANVGIQIGSSVTDTDGSEEITALEIGGIPTGANPLVTPVGSAVITPTVGGFIITGPEADILATIDTFTLTPELHNADDFDLDITVTATDADGSTATNTQTHPVTITPVADAPTVSVGAGIFPTEEDTPVSLTGLGGALTDTDGSETLGFEISGVPAGAVFNGGTDLGGGVWSFTPAELAALTFTPPADEHGTFDLTLTAISTEGSNGDQATTALPFSIVVDAQADTPSLTPGSSAINEDGTANVGIQIGSSVTDTDGSEEITALEIGGIPTGANPLVTPVGSAVITPTVGGFIITGPEADILATIDTFTLTPELHNADDFDLDITVTATDADGSTATNTQTHPVTITPVADAPSVGGGSYTTDEDTAVALPGLSGALVDADGSETLEFQITGVDPAASFTTGTDLGGGVWSFTPAEIGAGLTYNPPPQADGTFTMSIVSIATEDANGDQSTNTAPLVVTVNPILDTPNLTNGATTVNEDQVIPLGSDINLSIDDVDGSQDLTITLSGIPADVTPSFNGTLPGNVTNTGPGVWEITGTASQSLALLNSFTLGTTTHDDGNFQVSIDVTTVENGGASATSSATHDVVVQAVADAPSVSLASSPQGNEDTVVPVSIDVSLVDTDGSESINFVQISGVPSAATLTITPTGLAVVTDLGGGVWQVTGSDADIISTLSSGVTIEAGTHSGDDINLSVTAQTIESSPTEAGDIAVATANTVLPVIVDIVPVADQPSAAGGNYSTEEDTAVALAGIGGALVDTDGSENLTFTISDVPVGASFSEGTDLGGGVWSFTASQIANGISFTPPLNAHGTYNLTLTSVATEGENSDQATNTAPISIVVDAQADQATITGNGVGNEDTAINFGSDITVSLFDNDGSESITSITVTMTNGEVPTFSNIGGGNVTDLGGGQYQITGTETGIQATLDTFTITPPLHSDADIPFTVTATTQDADGSTSSFTRNRNIRVRAVADEPGGVANDVSGEEDNPILLDLIAANSADTDGSETISVLLTNLPVGSLITGNTGAGSITQQGNDFLIEAPDLAQLNAILATVEFTPPEHFSGIVNGQMQVISTESATGNQVSVPTATYTDDFTVTVNQVVDAPSITVVDAEEGAAGLEDSIIPLTIDVRLTDNDGSEQLGDVVISDIPTGAQIVNSAGVPIGTVTGANEVTVSIADLSDINIIPPLNSNDNFSLTIAASSTESPQGLGGDSSTAIGTATLVVEVIGVADPANLVAVPVVGLEDQPIDLGGAVSASLADTDGSETMYFVISGLPTGVVPSAGSYIGGDWQVSAADMVGLTIPAPANFSGDYIADFAPSLEIVAITQENDGDQTSVSVPLSITIDPVVDAASWSPGATVTEDNDIPLASAMPPSLIDGDGSEQVDSIVFDLSGVIVAAGIAPNVTDTNDLIANFVNGIFVDNGDGTITVQSADIGGVSLDASAFLDSNQDFGIPFVATFSDTGLTTATSTVSSTLSIDLVGDADAPTAFADDYSGNTGDIISINPTGTEFGGTSTDSDAAQGRPESESIHYVVSNLDGDANLQLAFVDAATGAPIGFNNNDGTWTLTPADLANIGLISAPGTSGAVTLTLTTIATENDGDVATSSTTFDVDVTPGAGGGPVVTPLPPLVTVNPMTVNEDGSIALDISVEADPADPSVPDATISVTLSGIPLDAQVAGAFFNPVNNTWVTDAATLSAGGVVVTPAPDWSGPINISVDATATNIFLQEASTNDVPAIVDVVPVADGPSISFTSPGGAEDNAIPVSIGIALQDTNGTQSEQLVEPITLTVGNGATLSAGIDLGGGVYELTIAELAGLTVTPAANSGDDIPITIEASTIELGNGDTASNVFNGSVQVSDVADAPTILAADSTGDEDTAIALAGLSASLVDTDGSEILSVTISGVPDGSILSAGSNNGDGSWTLTAAQLAGLTLMPPLNYSGTIDLTLTGFTVDGNGTTNSASESFSVTVNPIADGAVIAPLPQSGNSGEPIALNLEIAPGDMNGNAIGENPAETTQVILSGLSAGLVITSTGGIVEDLGGGVWQFSGTADEANTLAVIGDGIDGEYSIDVSVTMIDGASTGSPVTGTIDLTINPVANENVDGTNASETITGAGGNDTLSGLGGSDTILGGAGSDIIDGGANDDQITGGLGADILTGGSGADTFIWEAIDILSGATDQVMDFNVGEGDVLDLTALLSNFDPASDTLSDFINLDQQGLDTVVQIDQSGSSNFGIDVVTLTGTTGLDLATLQSNGNLVT